MELLFNFEGASRKLINSGTEIEGPRPGGVAQLGEHLPCKQGVMGSNPIISTRRKPRELYQMGS